MNDANATPDMDQKCPQCGAPLPSGVLAGLCPACLFKQGATADTAVPADATPFVPPGVADVAKLFPHLEIIELLGAGGMGAVYKARQRTLDRIVALKILPAQTTAGSSFIERFNREARALARLNHPNIVAVYEFGQMNGLPFFIMEFVDGLNLRQLERAGKLSPAEAIRIVPQICEALQFAHDEGIVHRDIKPENILLDKKGRVKIADFGIAKILGRQPDVAITETGGTVGTPHYMAPEQMEKPATVDHRADIFSLGVVFYEMLTGELPLGKFAPPSSRKVQVDVRLDDVVLRALEKDPELRYQKASHVKTAVDTIVGSAPPPPPPFGSAPSAAPDAEAFAAAILARDYTISIRSCLCRAWALLKKDFWPLVGVTALMLALLGFVSSFGTATVTNQASRNNTREVSSVFVMLVWGPLMGGLSLYYLRKIRRQTVNIEMAFSGFSKHFLHLFLGGFVTWILIVFGLFCFVLPGIYLLVAWWFTLTLVIDKQLDFWSAMELSRKVVTRHWWKLFSLLLVVLLLYALGMVCLFIGFLITAPLAMIAATYAYEDIFNQTASAAAPPPIAPAPGVPPPFATGPGGTNVVPPPPLIQPVGGKNWSLTIILGIALVAIVVGFELLMNFAPHHHYHPDQDSSAPVATTPDVPDLPTAPTPPPPDMPPPSPFGPVIEQTLTNFESINLFSNQTASLPASVTTMARGPDKDVTACSWLGSANMDFAYMGDYDGFYGLTRDMRVLPREAWDNETPDQLATVLHDSAQAIPEKFGDASPLNNPANCTYGFKTCAGSLGLMQVVGSVKNPSGIIIRYMVMPPYRPQVGSNTNNSSSETLLDRLEAASNISIVNDKDKLLGDIANEAAKAGLVDIVNQSLAQMFSLRIRDESTLSVTRVLSQNGHRKLAIELAKGINSYSIRNQALSELAQ